MDGLQQCKLCRKTFDASFMNPVEDPGSAVIPMSAQGEATPCARHARNAAESSCKRCGAFMCSLCRIDSDGGSYCPGCFERLSEEGALPSVRTSFKDYGRMSYHAGLLGALMFPIMIVTGPFGIWFGIVGLRAFERSGGRVSRRSCWLGICLGLVEVMIGLVFIIFVVRRS